MTTGAPGVAPVLRALLDAKVQFVVVGEPGGTDPLRVVVSRHPTNLEALGRALDRIGSTIRTATMAADASAPQRVGDPLGTIAITTSGGDVDLMFGGPRRSLFAETASTAQDREVDGLRVQWTEELPQVEAPPRVTSRKLGRRLVSLAEGIAHLIDGRDDASDGENGAGT